MSSHSFPEASSEALPSNSNAWVSFLFCGLGDSTTNCIPMLLPLASSYRLIRSHLDVTPELTSPTPFNGQAAMQEHGGTYSSRGTHLPTDSSPELPPLRIVDLWGNGPTSMGGNRFRIFAQPRGVENTLQGETWPFLYPTQGMCPSFATLVKPGSHPSRYRGPQYHQCRNLSTRIRHPLLMVTKINIFKFIENNNAEASKITIIE